MKKETLEWLELKERIAQRRAKLIKKSQENAMRIQKIESEGIRDMDDVVFYLEMNREGLVKVNNEAVGDNNQLLYIESSAIIRFIDNTLSLIKPVINRNNAETVEEYYGYQ